MGVFKAYDIRGRVPSELHEELSYTIGRALVTFLNCSAVVVGYDMRESSKALFSALTKGITDQGADVVSIGLCSTPQLYFAAKNAEAAVMITASHNPQGWNGMKICRAECQPIGSESGLKTIQQLVEENQFMFATKGVLKHREIRDEYIEHFQQYVKSHKKKKIVFDFGNAMSAKDLPDFLKTTKHDITYLYDDLDPSFPHHDANPLQYDTLRALQREVVSQKAHFGMATDGDGDRCVFVDEKGTIIPPDILGAFLAAHFLVQKKSAVAYDLRSSRVVPETILAHKGIPIKSRVGHTFIKESMRKENAPFALELSAHYYYKDTMYAESPLYTLIEVLNILSKTSKSLSALMTPYRKYYHTGELNFTVSDVRSVFDSLIHSFSDAKIDTVDGISLTYPTWWCNVRASNTEPLVRFVLEAESEGEMIIRRNQLISLIKSHS